jgi:hypothetical protein
MKAQIENLQTDTRYKRRLADWEPWKAVAVAAGAGAALMGAVIGILTLILRHG